LELFGNDFQLNLRKTPPIAGTKLPVGGTENTMSMLLAPSLALALTGDQLRKCAWFLRAAASITTTAITRAAINREADRCEMIASLKDSTTAGDVSSPILH
jgi:hypothetical protein